MLKSEAHQYIKRHLIMKVYAVFSHEADTEIHKATILKLYPPASTERQAIKQFIKDYPHNDVRLYSYNLDHEGEVENLYEVIGSRLRACL